MKLMGATWEMELLKWKLLKWDAGEVRKILRRSNERKMLEMF